MARTHRHAAVVAALFARWQEKVSHCRRNDIITKGFSQFTSVCCHSYVIFSRAAFHVKHLLFSRLSIPIVPRETSRISNAQTGERGHIGHFPIDTVPRGTSAFQQDFRSLPPVPRETSCVWRTALLISLAWGDFLGPGHCRC